ncbi:MAG: Bax inhibitor-1/YccA family protein [Nannocystaceae bacterium]|nr:Bax inhibitor-1/YccA family protein [Nannocystaceae bacterium]
MQGYHQQPQFAQRTSSRAELHGGVQQFMTGVYGWMTAGLGVTAAVIYGLSFSPDTVLLFALSPLRWVFFLGLLGIGWFAPSRIPNMDRAVAVGIFLVYSALMGAFISWIPLAYNLGSIASALGGTVGIFSVMALWGFFTKKDLSGMGQFLFMALGGAVIGSVINVLFLHSSAMGFAIAAIVAVVSAGLTAYTNQAIKQIYLMHGGGGNLAINGALALYVDFINLFLSLLRLFGSSRD